MTKKGIILLIALQAVWLKPVEAQSDYYAYRLENFRTQDVFLESIDSVHPDAQRMNAVLFYLTNEIRVKAGLSELRHQALLEASSSLHSESMVRQKFFDHINYKKKAWRTPNDRALAVGIVNPYLAENLITSTIYRHNPGEELYNFGNGIFRYKQDPHSEIIRRRTYLEMGDVLLKNWMNSPHHRDNIMSTDARELGCGVWFYDSEENHNMPYVMATQNFQLYEAVRINK